MALDPRIILQAGNVPQPRNLMQSYGNALAIQNAQGEMQQRQNAMEQEAARRRAMAEAYDPVTGEIDNRKIEGVYAQQGDIEGLQSFRKGNVDARKSDADRRKAELAAAREKLTTVGQILGGVNDQTTYDAARARLSEILPDADLIPEQYDPEMVAQSRNTALTRKEQLDQEWETRKFGLAERRTQAIEQGRMAPSVEINQGDTVMPVDTVEDAAAKDYGKMLVKDLDESRGRAISAQESLDQLYILKNLDVDTGATEPLRAWVSGLAESLGVPPGSIPGLDSATNPQAFEGIAQNLVLSTMQAQKGPQTENDAKRIERTIASLRNTPEAKEFLLNSAIALRKRALEEFQFKSRFFEENGTLRGATFTWTEYKKKTPLVADNPNTGRPVFVDQFVDSFLSYNPGATKDDALKVWRERYRR